MRNSVNNIIIGHLEMVGFKGRFGFEIWIDPGMCKDGNDGPEIVW